MNTVLLCFLMFLCGFLLGLMLAYRQGIEIGVMRGNNDAYCRNAWNPPGTPWRFPE